MRRLLGWACALITLCAAAEIQAAPLRVMGFGGSSNWPLFVAQERGLFQREGLEVQLMNAPDSATQLASLMDGRIDVAMTSVDNVIAYREGQVDPMPGGDRDLVALFGVNHGGRSSLMVRSDVPGIAQLKGSKLAVDAVSTGYAFVLEEMLHRGGLERGDYELVSVGGSRDRFAALRDGRVAGALLNAPVDAAAEKAGFKRLGTTAEVVKRYQGSVGAVRRAWAREHEKEVAAFIRAYVAAMDWLYDPANAKDAQAILLKVQTRLKPEDAQRSYDELLHPEHGSLSRRAAMDLEGLRTVVRLREKFATPSRKLGDPSRYYEPRYYEAALKP